MRHKCQQFEGGDAQAGASFRHSEWPTLLHLLDKIDENWIS